MLAAYAQWVANDKPKRQVVIIACADVAAKISIHGGALKLLPWLA
jgi:hypothetical protein